MYTNYQLTIISLSGIIFFVGFCVICFAFYKYRNVNLLKLENTNIEDDDHLLV